MPDEVKTGVDVASLSLIGASLLEWIPAVSALVSLVWVCIRIYETETIKRLLKK